MIITTLGLTASNVFCTVFLPLILIASIRMNDLLQAKKGPTKEGEEIDKGETMPTLVTSPISFAVVGGRMGRGNERWIISYSVLEIDKFSSLNPSTKACKERIDVDDNASNEAA